MIDKLKIAATIYKYSKLTGCASGDRDIDVSDAENYCGECFDECNGISFCPAHYFAEHFLGIDVYNVDIDGSPRMVVEWFEKEIEDDPDILYSI